VRTGSVFKPVSRNKCFSFVWQNYSLCVKCFSGWRVWHPQKKPQNTVCTGNGNMCMYHAEVFIVRRNKWNHSKHNGAVCQWTSGRNNPVWSKPPNCIGKSAAPCACTTHTSAHQSSSKFWSCDLGGGGLDICLGRRICSVTASAKHKTTKALVSFPMNLTVYLWKQKTKTVLTHQDSNGWGTLRGRSQAGHN
jgi:hypothetical protein